MSIKRALDNAYRVENGEEEILYCESNGLVLCTMPPMYQCKYCYNTWYKHQEPPICDRNKEGDSND